MTIPANIVTAVQTLLSPFGDSQNITEAALASILTPLPAKEASASTDILMTKKEAASVLKCSQMTVWRLANEGKIELYKRTKNAFAVSRESVLKYIESTRIAKAS